MHMGMCIAEFWGRQSVPEKILLVPASLYGGRHASKVRYAVQYTLLTLKPHATDTRAPNVMKAVSTAWSHFVNVMSDNLRLHTGFLVALLYLSNLSPHSIQVDESQTGRCPSGFVFPGLQSIQVTESERRTVQSYGDWRSFA